MKMIIKYNSICPLFLLLLIISCEPNKEDTDEVCGCTGHQENISNEGGLIVSSRDGYKIITLNYGILSTCTDIPTAFQKEGQLVLLSGKFITGCKKDYPGYGLRTQYFKFSEIKGIDSLYYSGPFTIKIIKTEDFGNPPGFGYEIFSSEKNFRIIQKEIPAQAGIEPFKTKEDALKIGYLVAYKLKNFDDFPSVYLGELFFLRIIDGQ